MRIQKLGIEGCFSIEHDVFPDNRGIFREWFKSSTIRELGIEFDVAQANFSVSEPGVIRGLHYSLSPMGQSKVVTCVQGGILDQLVDIRIGSPTYLEQVSIWLDSSSGNSVLIATGVAHGFSVPKERSAICYLTSSEFSAADERGINPMDRTLNVDWSLPSDTQRTVSKADLQALDYKLALATDQLPTYEPREK